MSFTLNVGSSTSTLTLSCDISSVWFGIVFDATQMASNQRAIIFGGSSHSDSIMDYPMATHSLGSPDASSVWTLTGTTTIGSTTTITLARDNAASGDHPELSSSATSINVIFAHGSSTNIAYHGISNRIIKTVSVSTAEPTANPTTAPTTNPTANPTNVGDTLSPTSSPTFSPTAAPTVNPSQNPTENPTNNSDNSQANEMILHVLFMMSFILSVLIL